MRALHRPPSPGRPFHCTASGRPLMPPPSSPAPFWRSVCPPAAPWPPFALRALSGRLRALAGRFRLRALRTARRSPCGRSARPPVPPPCRPVPCDRRSAALCRRRTCQRSAGRPDRSQRASCAVDGCAAPGLRRRFSVRPRAGTAAMAKAGVSVHAAGRLTHRPAALHGRPWSGASSHGRPLSARFMLRPPRGRTMARHGPPFLSPASSPAARLELSGRRHAALSTLPAAGRGADRPLWPPGSVGAPLPAIPPCRPSGRPHPWRRPLAIVRQRRAPRRGRLSWPPAPPWQLLLPPGPPGAAGKPPIPGQGRPQATARRPWPPDCRPRPSMQPSARPS